MANITTTDYFVVEYYDDGYEIQQMFDNAEHAFEYARQRVMDFRQPVGVFNETNKSHDYDWHCEVSTEDGINAQYKSTGNKVQMAHDYGV